VSKEPGLIVVAHLIFQAARVLSKYGLVQHGLMWRRVELGFGNGSGRYINPNLKNAFAQER
jgi:uncharacterized membrane protein YecN with MAPEG domain